MADFSSLSERTVKVAHDGAIYRGKLSVSSGANSSQAFSSIKATVAALVGLSEDRLCLKYSDEEGDLCTLTEVSMTDLLSLYPEGVLRLSLQIREASMQDTSILVETSTSSAMNVDEASAYSGTNSTSDAKAGDTLRARLAAFLQKIPPGLSGIALSLVENMDPSALHGMVAMIKEQKAAHKEHFKAVFPSASDDTQQHMDELSELFPGLLDMEPAALKSLIIEELRKVSASSSVPSNAGAQQQQPQQDPLSTLLGTFLGGNSSPQPNPLGQLFGALFAGKGSGKGACSPQSARFPPDMSAPNAWEGMFQNGFPQNSHGPQAQNPLETMLGALFACKGAGKGCGAGYSMPGNPTNTCNVPFSNSAPQTSHAESPTNTCTAPCSNSAPQTSHADPARAVFEDSVTDLVNMGLVTDRQVARELLTTHGDISTVVSILTENA